MEESGNLQGVRNALQVMEVLARHGPELGVADVGRRLDLPRSTAYRLLSTLEHHGFVEQNPESRKYRLGLKLFELAGVASRNLGIGEIARPYLEQLALQVEETVHLAVADRGEALVIEKVDGPREVYLRTHVGTRRPFHSTATGKALLAFLPEKVVEAVIARGLPRFTGTTVTEADRLRSELAEIRARGFAMNWGEFREEAAGVAAPVRGRGGQAVASVGVAAPIGRVTPHRAETIARFTLECAARISTRLGGWSEGGAQPALAAGSETV